MNLHVLHGTCEDIKSYEGEGTVVVASVGAAVLAQHEAHVRFEGKVFRGLSSDGMCARPADRGPPDEPIEVGDGRGLSSGSWQEYVEQRPVRTQQL